ncbi:MAG TPA: methyltransferase domain-containing protein [Geothrix sp.]|jgi:hypothetical protein
MVIDGYCFMADSVTKFYNFLRIAGWFHHHTDRLVSVRLLDSKILVAIPAVGLAHGGASKLGKDKGFELQVMRDCNGFEGTTEVEFTTQSGRTIRASLSALCEDRLAKYPSPGLTARFKASVESIPGARVLDIGGRARSGLLRRDLFHVDEFVVMDIVADDNVDVVGDAHELDRYFPENHFDGVLSVSVFEHLMMPWVVATQMNRVLKLGGLGLVVTHQTLGMHDLPWDFWRFSDSAWDALFNEHTGFEIVDRVLDGIQHVVPMVFTPNKIDSENAVGFECSAVLVRKIGPCRMSWQLTAADITSTMYPKD